MKIIPVVCVIVVSLLRREVQALVHQITNGKLFRRKLLLPVHKDSDRQLRSGGTVRHILQDAIARINLIVRKRRVAEFARTSLGTCAVGTTRTHAKVISTLTASRKTHRDITSSGVNHVRRIKNDTVEPVQVLVGSKPVLAAGRVVVVKYLGCADHLRMNNVAIDLNRQRTRIGSRRGVGLRP